MRTQLLFAACAIAIAAPLFSMAQTATPFNIAVRNYAYIGKPGLNADPTTISLFTSTNPAAANGGFPSTGLAIQLAGGGVPPQNLNGAGISNKDGYMYAMEYLYGGPFASAGSLYRIGANAVVQQVGSVIPPTLANTGYTPASSFVNLASATMDARG